MHDPVDIRRRIDHLVTRVDRRDDYGQLLARGQVIHRLGDVAGVDAWRAEIRRQARADKIRSAPASTTASSGRCGSEPTGQEGTRRSGPTAICSGARFPSPSNCDTNRPSCSGTATR